MNILEIEPLKNVGVALSEATLQELAYSLGIEKSVSAMSEAEKAQLRYIQIMKSSSDWQADMGKTLMSPANALRVVKQQFTLLAKAIGNVFIPIVMLVLPYVIALTDILTSLANVIANFVSNILGIKIDFGLDDNTFNTSVGNITTGLEDIGTEADKTKNKLNTMLAPFDDLNVVQEKSKSDSGGSGLDNGLGGDLGVPLPTYDALSKLTDKFKDNIEKAKNNLKSLLPIVLGIGAGIGLWNLFNFLNDIKKAYSQFSSLQKSILKIASGIIMIGIGVYFMLKGNEGAKNNPDDLWKNVALQIGGNLLIGAGTYVLTKNFLLTAVITGIGFTISGVTTMSHGEEENMWAGIAQSLTGIGLAAAGTFAKTKSVTFTLLVTAIAAWSGVGVAIKGLLDLKPTWQEVSDAINEIFGNIPYAVIDWCFDAKDTLIQYLEDLNTNLNKWFTDFKSNMSKKWDDFWVNIGNKFDYEKQKWSDNWDNFKNTTSEIWSEMWENIKTTLSNKWTDAKNWFQTNIGTAQDWKNRFSSILNGANGVLNDLKQKFENWTAKIKTPHLEWQSNGIQTSGVIKKVLEALNLPTSLPKLSVKWYENGGYPDSADLFFANENGIPEMVGRIGNQTAVANNDQITTSITNALISALDKYNFGSNNSPTTIYIGNKKVYEGYGDYIKRENDRYGTNTIRI